MLKAGGQLDFALVQSFCKIHRPLSLLLAPARWGPEECFLPPPPLLPHPPPSCSLLVVLRRAFSHHSPLVAQRGAFPLQRSAFPENSKHKLSHQ